MYPDELAEITRAEEWRGIEEAMDELEELYLLWNPPVERGEWKNGSYRPSRWEEAEHRKALYWRGWFDDADVARDAE